MDLFKRESPAEKEKRITQEAIAVIRMKWSAYHTIMAGGTVHCGDKKLYTSVRKRLRGAFHGDEEKLSRFKYIKDD